MLVFEVIIALLLAGAGLTVLSRRIGTPYPAMVALAGAALALIPGTPTLVLDPQLALALFVAPVLLDAAFDSSIRDLRANWRNVAGLALGAVLLTVVVVAVVVRLLVPRMPWPVAIALGAIVAPPDAAAATAVLKQLRPPQRLIVILEGESLFNDASALLIYRLALGVALAGAPLSPAIAIPQLFVITAGSVVLAYVLSRVVVVLTTRTHDVAIAVVLQFCGTFAVWLLAERLHLSGVLTMVVFAMVTARRVADLTPARMRIPSYAVWEVAVFVLNVLAFILVGFQLKAILGRIDARTVVEYAVIGSAVCATTIVARIGWVSVTAAITRWRYRPAAGGSAEQRDAVTLSPRAAALVGWCGMRGIVTLATALALPTTAPDGSPFPYRDLILFVAFSVTLGTLVIQGMTLRPLMNVLHLEDDGTVDREVRLARVEIARAALIATPNRRGEEIADLQRRRYEVMLRRAEADLAAGGDGQGEAAANERRAPDVDATVVREALSAERHRLLALRADGTIGDTAFQRVEQGLDLEELHLQQLVSITGDLYEE
jgi:CPA1 family monovalent cation:H+ antiporter